MVPDSGRPHTQAHSGYELPLQILTLVCARRVTLHRRDITSYEGGLVLNPGCTDRLNAPAERQSGAFSNLDWNRNDDFVNLRRGRVGDVVESGSCGDSGWCPRSHPMCHHGQCVIPTCSMLVSECYQSNPLGFAVRQECPQACGCDDATSPIVSTPEQTGCSQSCDAKLAVSRAQVPCVDSSADGQPPLPGSPFERFLNSVLNVSANWPLTIRSVVLIDLPRMQAHGCSMVAEISASTSVRDYCHGTMQLPIKPMSIFCPVACGCVGNGGGPSCPATCASVQVEAGSAEAGYPSDAPAK